MHSCSVKLTFSDDDFYNNFIDPRRINGELPTLVLRLLTAYATNDELACQIDQYVDRGDPEVYEARELLLSALTGLNTLSSMTAQALEANADALAEDEEDEGTTAANEDDDAVDIDALLNGADIPMPHIPDRSAEESVATVSHATEVYTTPTMHTDVPEHDVYENVHEREVVHTAPIQQDNSEVMTAISLLTQQVSALTGSVSSLVTVIKTDVYKPQEEGVSVGGVRLSPEENNASTGHVEGSTTTLKLAANTANEKQERTKLAEEIAKGTTRVVYVDANTKTIVDPSVLEQPTVEKTAEPITRAAVPEVETPTTVKAEVEQPVSTTSAVETAVVAHVPVVAPVVTAPAVSVAAPDTTPAPVAKPVEPEPVSAPVAKPVEPEPVPAPVVKPVEPEPVEQDDEYDISIPDFMSSMLASIDTPDEEEA